ncbi:MAG TPA: hypothetical protein VGP63_14220 [Planctomycetaceae bacterium]|jgi:hypothetical protein|nr:hypothetical protein [Planctomycetaceae bacterium]
MSEPIHAPTLAGHDDPPSPGEGGPFSEQQIEQFEEDDGDAGRAIGKMLATFFFYTVIAMSLVAWWTFHHQSAVAQ